MQKNDVLQALIDAYETPAMTWDWRADGFGENAPPEGWSAELLEAIVMYRHQAETCRYLAQEVRESRL